MTQPHSAIAAATPLRHALKQNATIKDAVAHSADELLVINAVLQKEIPEQVQMGEVAQALEGIDELEDQIAKSAEDLAQVNQALEQEIGERAELEGELAATRDALAKVKQQRS